jgi:hypothetical protein
MYPLPASVWLLVLIGTIGLPTITFAVLYGGAQAQSRGRGTAISVVAAAGLGWAMWTGTSYLLADAGRYQLTQDVTNPLIGVAALIAIAAALLFTRIPVVSQILAKPDMIWRLTLPQVLRVCGGTAFILTLALGELPAVFAVPAGLGDIAIGIEAVFLARKLRHGDPRRGALWFNVLGLLDLAVAMSVGLLAAPGAIRVLTVTPSTAPIALLPLALIPTVMVPMAVALHVISLTKIRAATRASRLDRPHTTIVQT